MAGEVFNVRRRERELFAHYLTSWNATFCVEGASYKESGIVNDANLWATETMDNVRYPLELFLRVITVSLETMKIVKALPRLDIQSAAELIPEADDLEPLAVSL